MCARCLPAQARQPLTFFTGAFSICLPQTWARCLPRQAAQSEEEVFRALIVFFALTDFVLLSEVARFRAPAVAAMVGAERAAERQPPKKTAKKSAPELNKIYT